MQPHLENQELSTEGRKAPNAESAKYRDLNSPNTHFAFPAPGYRERSQFMEQSQLTSGTEAPDFYHQAPSLPQFSAELSHCKHLLLQCCSPDPFAFYRMSWCKTARTGGKVVAIAHCRMIIASISVTVPSVAAFLQTDINTH